MKAHNVQRGNERQIKKQKKKGLEKFATIEESTYIKGQKKIGLRLVFFCLKNLAHNIS